VTSLAVVASIVAGGAFACVGAIGNDDGSSISGGNGPDGPGSTASGVRDPGTKTIHRLNRVEYNNTVRDLLNTALKPAADFPQDDHGYGFDNIADVLSLSPLQLELYERAAERLVDEAFAKPEMASKLVPCTVTDAACPRTAISAFATKAFRRPTTEEDMTKLLSFVELAKGEGQSALEGIKLAMRATLVSPHFIFRVELDPTGGAHALSEYELASRLSYFLWSSMPDDTLFASAAAGKLHEPDELKAQALRLLADPRADSLIANFAGQWLQARAIDDIAPEKAAFPEFDDTLRKSMKKEAELFFGEFLRGDLDMKGFLTADFTFIDDRLAKHYAMPTPSTPWAKTTMDTTKRRGLLGLASILTITSYPNRTSPVKRGRWVLEQMLCTPPPPPPPGVEGLMPEPMPTGTLRQRMEAHRKQPVCSSCHSMMDPIGFGLENFDGIGKWRTEEAGFTIDSSGVLPGSGQKFSGGAELGTALGEDARVGRCIAQHMFTYALGRGPTVNDQIYLDEIADKTKTSGNRMKDLIVEIVTSEPFRMRGGAK
jgi:hypothetical protein